MKRTKVFYFAACAIFAAMSAILSQISVPIGIVPVNFVHISLFLAGGLLGWKWGTVSQLVFVLMGALGLPVFSGFAGGLGTVLGPTGGFILGYLFCTAATGAVVGRFGASPKSLLAAILLGWILTYIPGVAWYMYITGAQSLPAALLLVWLPFIPGDMVKSILAAVLLRRLKRFSLIDTAHEGRQSSSCISAQKQEGGRRL